MKLSLRDLFLSPEALDPGNNPLVRLGALHHLRRISDRDQVRRRLEGILKEQDTQGLRSTNVDSTVFAFHVAVALAQEGSTEGVEWLLRYLGGSQKHQKLASTALRNCRQFPLAVLLGSAVEKQALDASYRDLGDLAAFSEDQAWSLAEPKNHSRSVAMVSTLESALDHLKKVVKPGSRLGLGTVITRPFRKPAVGLRYTGFLIVEEAKKTFRAIPYEIADLINRDDGAAKVIAWDLLQPGRKVIVAYESTEQAKAKVLYVLPFGPPQDVQKLLEQAALSCEGVTVGVVVHRWESRTGWMYRIVSASGQTEVGHERRCPMTIGTCSLLHKSSTQPFSTRFSLSQAATGKVLASFVQNTALERATLLNAWENGHKLARPNGKVIIFGDQPPVDIVVFLETKTIKDSDQTFPVRLPSIAWLPEHRSAVLQDFFANSPKHYAVVIALLQISKGITNALIVHPQSGTRQLRRIISGVGVGTIVFWELKDAENIYTTFLTDQLVYAQCHLCLGTGLRVCATCNGTDRIPCTNCGGTGQSQCLDCAGTSMRRSDCRACRGTGNCGNCNGNKVFSVSCRTCGGTGHYADTGRQCIKCKGVGTVSLPCKVCADGPQPRGICPNCKGTGDYFQECRSCRKGRRRCEICRTSGIVECNRCNGTLIGRCACGGATSFSLRPVRKEAERGLR